MKTKTLISLLALLSLLSSLAAAAPLGAAFGYQGRLAEGGNPANGSYDLQFALYDAVTNGNQLSPTLTNAAVTVSNGLFTVLLDFGTGIFTGDVRWLEIAVRTNDSASAFTSLSPRQELAPTPYALYAPAAGTANSASNLIGVLAASQLSGTCSNALQFNNPGNSFAGSFAGDGSGLTNLNADSLAAGTLPGARLAGAYGSALTFSNASNSFTGNGAGLTGLNASGLTSGTVPSAQLSGTYSSALTFNNTANSFTGGSFTGNGAGLTGLSASSLASGTVPSAQLSGTYSSALTFNNTANSFTGSSFTGNGAGLTDLSASSLASGTVPSARLSGTYSSALTLSSTANSFSGSGGGLTSLNASQLTSGTVPAAALGNAWKITGNSGTTPGTHFLGTTDNAALELKVANTRVVRLEPGSQAVNVICGYSNNSVAVGALGATIAGGGYQTASNRVNSSSGTIGGGFGNTVSGQNSTVAGGADNTIQTGSDDCVIGGGFNNSIQSSSEWCSIGGGWNNLVQSSAPGATIAGGYGGAISNSAANSTIGGGAYNAVWSGAQYATIPGGEYNQVGGNHGFAAGYRAKAYSAGTFVWADSQNADFASTAGNQFLIRASGGVGIGTNSPAAALDVVGDTWVRGLIRSGSETGTSEPPNLTGMVVRRINSTSQNANQVVAVARNHANNANITLERDGTAGGFLVRYPANPGSITIACMGMDSTGAQRNSYTALAGPSTAGTVQVYTNSQNIVHFECTIGDTWDEGHLTQVTLSRYGAADNYWLGTLMSTYNH